jgi:hypothetical protein
MGSSPSQFLSTFFLVRKAVGLWVVFILLFYYNNGKETCSGSLKNLEIDESNHHEQLKLFLILQRRLFFSQATKEKEEWKVLIKEKRKGKENEWGIEEK